MIQGGLIKWVTAREGQSADLFLGVVELVQRDSGLLENFLLSHIFIYLEDTPHTSFILFCSRERGRVAAG